MSINVTNLQARRQQLITEMEQGSVAIILSGNPVQRTHDQYHDFVVFRNFFYLTNIDRSNFALVLVKTETETKEMLFIDEVSEMEEKWSGFRMKKAEASALSGIDEKFIFGMPDMRKYVGSYMMNDGITNGYFDLERFSYDHLDTQNMIFAKEFKAQYPFLNLHNLHSMLSVGRQVKTADEVANIKTAVEKTKIGLESVLKALKPGMFEYEVESYYDFAIKTNGVQQKAFHTIAATGANATVLHYEANNTKTKDGDLMLFDLGCAWNNYAADISRTYPVNGKFSERQKAVYQSVLDVEKAVIEAIKPGVKWSDLNKLAKDILADKCRELGLIGDNNEDVLNYYYHTIGHSLGLDTHDIGGRDFVLKSGMVVTVEPGLYIAEEGIGIRIEDDILVTENGHENLSIDIIKEIADIESFMQK